MISFEDSKIDRFRTALQLCHSSKYYDISTEYGYSETFSFYNNDMTHFLELTFFLPIFPDRFISCVYLKWFRTNPHNLNQGTTLLDFKKYSFPKFHQMMNTQCLPDYLPEDIRQTLITCYNIIRDK